MRKADREKSHPAMYSEAWYRDSFSTRLKDELVHLAAHLQVLSDERFKEILKLRELLAVAEQRP